MRREFPVGPHDDGRLLEPQGRDPVHHRRDPQARGFPPGTLSWGSLHGEGAPLNLLFVPIASHNTILWGLAMKREQRRGE